MERLRRLRISENMRRMVRETRVNPEDLIYPIFVTEGTGHREPVSSMPGVYRQSSDMIGDLIKRVHECGISGVMVFGIPDKKDEVGSGAYAADGAAQTAIRRIKDMYPDMLVTADVCLCEYTSHGHCGLVKDGKILNDETLPVLAKAAVSLTEAGADIIAPSDMMDGRIGYIRAALDESGFANRAIMAYSAKFASAYYGPFREAADSTPAFGDRRSYQMDPANGREAMREIAADIAEGADIVMVKPALAYLDVVKEASERFDVPLATYNVSGEYAMVKAAAANGWIDEQRVVAESLTAMKRAGAKIIITYHALDAAEKFLNA